MFGHPNDEEQQDSTGQPAPQDAAPTDNSAVGAPAAPTTDDTPDDTAGDYIMTEGAQPAARGDGTVATDTDGLLDIKQQALRQLSPLVGHLDQTPEEEFRTTMMMIQAADDQSLVKKAYDAAQKIGDEKVKAQALLDIVNEINYFTQHKDTGSES